MTTERKNYTAREKVSILRKHLLEKVPVSDLCDQLGLQPSVFYRWLKLFFENGEASFEPKPGKKKLRQEQRIIAALEVKIQKKDEVIGELMEEHVALKKSLGGS